MSASTSPKESKEPNSQEARFFWAMIKNMKTPISSNINWDGVAIDMNLKNGSCASVRYGQIKKKLGLDSASGSPSTPRKRQAGAIKTPSKSGKSTRSTSAKQPKVMLRPNKQGYAEVVDGDGLEDDDEIGGFGEPLGPLQLDFGVKTEVKVDGSAEKETTTAEPAAKRQKVMDAIKVKAKDKTYDSIDAILAEPEPDEDDEFTDAAFYHNYTTAAEKQPENKTYGYGNGGGVFDC